MRSHAKAIETVKDQIKTTAERYSAEQNESVRHRETKKTLTWQIETMRVSHATDLAALEASLREVNERSRQ